MSHDILNLARSGVTILPNEAKRLAAYCDKLYEETVQLRVEVARLTLLLKESRAHS